MSPLHILPKHLTRYPSSSSPSIFHLPLSCVLLLIVAKVLMLVGTKTDLQYLREVSTEEALEYAQREHMMFMETSAQSAFNVEEAFTEVTKSMHPPLYLFSLSLPSLPPLSVFSARLQAELLLIVSFSMSFISFLPHSPPHPH